MEKRRNQGINILRILSMLGIIGLHILNAGGAMLRGGETATSAALHLSYIFCICSVDVFAMITGYLYCGRESVRYENILNLLATVLFYCVTITLAFLALPGKYFENPNNMKFSLFPMLVGRYWYITCYVLVFVLIPYLNILINRLSRNQFRNLVLILVFLTSALTTCFDEDFFRMQDGYSSAWLIVCYFIGAYIKRECQNVSAKKCIWIILGITAAVFLVAKGGRNGDNFLRMTQYTSLSVVVMSAMFVMLFSAKPQLFIGGAGVWNTLGRASFDVYILHAHIMIFNYIITDHFLFLQEISAVKAILLFCLILTGIYLLGWILYCVRTALFRAFHLNVLLASCGAKIDKRLFVDFPS